MVMGSIKASMLSQLVFLLYVNDVGSSIHQGRQMYTADTTLCFNVNSTRELEMVTFTKLNSAIQHFIELNLITNPSKSNFIRFSLQMADSDCSPSIMLDEPDFDEFYSKKHCNITSSAFVYNYCSQASVFQDNSPNITRIRC